MTEGEALLIRFKEFLLVIKKEFAIVLTQNDKNLVSGAITTSCIPLPRFVEMFKDLLDAGNYRLESWQKYNRERGYQISDDVFGMWKAAGCLVD